MGIKVAKFGGTSVADAIQIAKIKDIVKKDKDIRYVVVSAPGKRFEQDSKVTDLLYSCKTHMEHNLPYEQLFQVIRDRYTSMASNLGVSMSLTEEFDIILDNMRNSVSVDYIASRGEYLNAMMIADYLGFDFIDAESVIHFDSKGRFLEQETNDSLAKVLPAHKRAVIPGFYGSKPDGSIKTFSRGGSDITGSIIARAVKADIYENWTDVSGFLVADPRIVENPKRISEISYRELRELSYMGASVLHEDAIYPVRHSAIPINIKNTNAPEDPGTLITDNPSEEAKKRIVTGIAGSKDFSVIGLSKTRMNSEKGFIRRLTSILEDMDITIEHMPSGIDTISVVLDNAAIDGRMDEIVDEMQTQLKPDDIEVFENMALIATVGQGMSYRPGVSARLFKALAEAKVNVRMIDQGSSEMNIIIGIKNDDFEKAIRAIYDAFMNEDVNKDKKE